MRSQLTPIIQRVQGMIDYVRENLDDEEYDLFLDLISPEPERVVEKSKPRKPKKILHCDACDYTKRHKVHKDSSRSDYHEFQPPKSAAKKSSRAKSIAEAVQKVTKVKLDDDDQPRCMFIVNDATGEECGTIEDDPIHDLTYSSSHEFAPGESRALAAGGE